MEVSFLSGTWQLPKHITRNDADVLNGIIAAKEHLAKCQKHAVYSPYFILHVTPIQETGKFKQEVKKEKSSQSVKSCSKHIKDRNNPAELAQKSAINLDKTAGGSIESKILCPIHDLYK